MLRFPIFIRMRLQQISLHTMMRNSAYVSQACIRGGSEDTNARTYNSFAVICSISMWIPNRHSKMPCGSIPDMFNAYWSSLNAADLDWVWKPGAPIQSLTQNSQSPMSVWKHVRCRNITSVQIARLHSFLIKGCPVEPPHLIINLNAIGLARASHKSYRVWSAHSSFSHRTGVTPNPVHHPLK